MKGNHYGSDEEVVAAVRQWCREQSPEFFADGIRQLVRRWQLCVDRDGDYVEKINMRCVAEVSSFNLMYNLCMYYEKQKSNDKTELTFQPTLVLWVFLVPTGRTSVNRVKVTHDGLVGTGRFDSLDFYN